METLRVFKILVKHFCRPPSINDLNHPQISCVDTILAVPNHHLLKKNFTLASGSDSFARPPFWDELGLGPQDDPLHVSSRATPASG